MKQFFPFFRQHPDCVFFDNASTTQKPDIVLKAMNTVYTHDNYGVDSVGNKEIIRDTVRSKVSRYFTTQAENIAFGPSVTWTLNHIALSFPLTKNNHVVLSAVEHHSHYLPWIEKSRSVGAEYTIIHPNSEGVLEPSSFKNIPTNTSLVALTHCSNITGLVTDIESCIQYIRTRAPQSYVIIDGSQLVGHKKVAIDDIGCDGYVFGGHKMYAPLGVSVFVANKRLQSHLKPAIVGGKMVESVVVDTMIPQSFPYSFEPGTPDLAAIAGLGAALDFLTLHNAQLTALQSLTAYAEAELRKIDTIHIVAENKSKLSIVSIFVEGVDSYDLAVLLSDHNIITRAGSLCAQPLIDSLGIDSVLRLSFGIYTTIEEVDKMIEVLSSSITLLQQAT